MTIKIGNYNFEGPYANASDVRSASGVYVILGRSGVEPYRVLDVGESANMQDRLRNHDRQNQWAKCGYAHVHAAVLYVNGYTRMDIERTLRSLYNPTCGIR